MKKYLPISIAGIVLVIGSIYLYHKKERVAPIIHAPVTQEVPSAPSILAKTVTMKSWVTYHKPNDATLRMTLSPLAYSVTQQSDTETPYTSEYTHSTALGIYVDVVSGEPLFSSKDKYDSGTGWPSFVKPITSDAVTYHADNEMGIERTEVRSTYADSHLGHVFDDGPVGRGGKRYCMNGVALRFIEKDRMVEEGYGEYLKYV